MKIFLPIRMSTDEFVYRVNLRPADVVVVNKAWGFLDHYVVYLGQHRGQHIFVANMLRGVKVLSQQELMVFLPKFTFNRVRHFIGNHYQREAAVRRAANMVGRKGYDLLSANCEHFANYVQTGRAYSQQTQIATGVGIFLGACLLLNAVFGGNNGEEEDDETYY